MNVESTSFISQKTRCPPLFLPPSSSIARVGYVWLGVERHACRETGRPAPKARPTRLSGRAGGGARTREPPPRRRGRSPWPLSPPLRSPGGAGRGRVRGECAGPGPPGRLGRAIPCGGAVAGAAWASPWGALGWVRAGAERAGGRRGAARLGGAVLPQPQRWGRTGGLRRPSLAGGTGSGVRATAALPPLLAGESGEMLPSGERFRGRLTNLGSSSSTSFSAGASSEKAPSCLEPFLPGFLLGNRPADPSLGPAVAGELSESPGF